MNGILVLCALDTKRKWQSGLAILFRSQQASHCLPLGKSLSPSHETPGSLHGRICMEGS